MKPQIEFPAARRELLWQLRTLSDSDYQQQAWVNRCYWKGAEGNDLWAAYELLFDVTDFADNPDKAIGKFLYDTSEAVVLSPVVRAYEVLEQRYGYQKLTDEEYLAKPEWHNVIEAAEIAYQQLVANTAKYEPPEHVDENGWPTDWDLFDAKQR